MRLRALIPLSLALAAPLSAQGFEGTLTMRMSMPGSPLTDAKVHYADGKQALVASANMGGMAGEMRMVMNHAERRMTTFMSMPGMPGGGKIKTVTQLDEATTGTDVDLKVTKLGTTQTVAGLRCDDYELSSQGQVSRLCATEALGRIMLPSGPGQRGAGPAWSRAFGNRPVFPLKVTNPDGSVLMEVTAIDRRAPDRALFDENTPGYTTMSGMPGARRN